MIDTLRDYVISHLIDGCDVECGRCGLQIVAPAYILPLATIVAAAAAHSEVCTG